VIGWPRAEVREPHRADEILKLASAFFAAGPGRPRPTSRDSPISTKMCSGSIGSGLSALRRGEDMAVAWCRSNGYGTLGDNAFNRVSGCL
jgi:hypothetical protein